MGSWTEQSIREQSIRDGDSMSIIYTREKAEGINIYTRESTAN